MTICRYSKVCEYYENPKRKCFRAMCANDDFASELCQMFAVIKIKESNP